MTLGEFRSFCQTALGDTSATTLSQINLGLVRAIDVYKTQRFSWNRIKWELTTTAADNSYTSIGQVDSGATYTANQVFALDTAQHLEDGRITVLEVVDFDSLFRYSESEDTGRPRAIAIGAQEFLVTPVPDDAYVLQGLAVVDVNQSVGSYTEITTSAADAAINPWLERADKMLQSFTLAEVFRLYKREPKWAAVYANDASQEFQRHVQDFERRESNSPRSGYFCFDRGYGTGYF